MTPRSAIAFLCGCTVVCAAWAQSLEVIDLKFRTAEEIIPIVQPLLESGAAISGQDYKLFVRTGSANLAQVRAAIAQIDRQPTQLLVSVRQSTQQEIERERTSASASVRSGDNGIAVNEASPGRSGVTVRATDSTSRTSGNSVSSVQVLEGGSAFIAAGSSVPIVTAVAVGGGRRPWLASSTGYRDLSSGFAVTPRVNGEHVILDIEQQAQRVVGGDIETQRLTTQVSGALGEWIQLGGVNESSASRQTGILRRQYATNSDARTVWVKVDRQ